MSTLTVMYTNRIHFQWNAAGTATGGRLVHRALPRHKPRYAPTTRQELVESERMTDDEIIPL